MEKELNAEQKNIDNNRDNGITEVVFIIDKSGSMSGLEDDTIGGFNSNLDKQKKIEGEVIVSTVLFNEKTLVLHNRKPIEIIGHMTDEDYCPGGCTALLDAIGGGIHHIGNVHRYTDPDKVPGKTVFIIITDGMENASRYYTYSKVKKMIEMEQNLYGWEFVFIGANMDAVAEAGRIGIRHDRAVRYCCDREGTEKAYHAMDKIINSARFSRTVDAEALFELDEDYKNRKK